MLVEQRLHTNDKPPIGAGLLLRDGVIFFR